VRGEKQVLADSCGYHQIKIRTAQASTEANTASRQNVSPVSPVQSCKGDQKRKKRNKGVGQVAGDAVTSLSACIVSVFAFVKSGEFICVTAKLLSLTASPLNEYKNPVESRSHSEDVCSASFSSLVRHVNIFLR